MLRRHRSWLAALLLLAGCEPLNFTLPERPQHNDEHNHAQPFEDPFLCRNPNNPKVGEPCPLNGVRPPDEQLSCDALYCHGDFEYRADQVEGRKERMFGSDGPSCYTCHGVEWHPTERYLDQ